MNETERNEFEVLSSEFKEFNSKMKDPLVVGALLNKLSEERQSTNLLLKQILEKLDRISSFEARIESIESKIQHNNQTNTPLEEVHATAPSAPVILAKVDEDIVTFVRSTGRVCAQMVAEKFKYRGKNAASARLNRLVDKGHLTKQQVGREIYFLPK